MTELEPEVPRAGAWSVETAVLPVGATTLGPVQVAGKPAVMTEVLGG